MQFLTVQEVADILKVDPRTVRTLILKSELIALKVGGEYRIDEDDFLHYVKMNKTGQAGDPKQGDQTLY